MKNYLIVFLSIFTLSCAKKKEKEKVSAIDSSIINLPDSVYVSANKGFLDGFKITEDSVHLYTPPENNTQPIRGTKQLDPEFLKLFPEKLAIGNTQKPEIFAVQKFKIDKNNTALITQNPGEYSLSSLNLMVYNHQAEAISGLLEVADEVGDAGFYSKKQTVLVKDSGKVKGLMWYTTSIEPVDAQDPTNPVKTSEYFSVKIKNGKIDTATASKEEIARYKSYFK